MSNERAVLSDVSDGLATSTNSLRVAVLTTSQAVERLKLLINNLALDHSRSLNATLQAATPTLAGLTALLGRFAGLMLAQKVALILAVSALVVGPPATANALRNVGASWSSALALAFLVAAAGAVPRRTRVERVRLEEEKST